MAPSSPLPPLPEPAPHRFVSAVVGAALRRLEEGGPLDDEAALQRAFSAGRDRAQQIALRNAWLGERLGLLRELARWRQLALLLVLVLALLMALTGLAAARSVLAPDRSINAVAAVVGVLALPTLTLLLWLLGWTAGGRGVGTGGWSFGHVVVSLAARLPLGRGAHAPQLLQALLEIMRRQRLWPWFSGMVSHAVWLLALVLTVLALVFGFSFQSYRLSWETTILSAGFFQQFVAASGWLPHVLGFAVPDAAAIQQVGNAAAGTDLATQRAWAWWVMGCITVYGLLPRLLLLLLSAWRWRARLRGLVAVDMADPYNQRLARRLDALAPPPQVVDPEQGGVNSAKVTTAGTNVVATTNSPAVIGFELPAEWPWPLPGLPPALTPALRVDGSAQARRQLVQQLAAATPRAVLVVLHAPASPDRGTARFLREVAHHAGRCAVLLAGVDGTAPVAPDAAARWREWLPEQGLDFELLLQTSAVASWLGAADA